MEILLWLLIFLVFYAYVGYGILLFVLVKIKRLFTKPYQYNTEETKLPEVTYLVAAYNEENWIEDKIKNSLAFDYPKDRIQFYFVTDGSDDSTTEKIRNYPVPEDTVIKVFFKPERKGKIAAVERVMEFVETPIVIYSDANAFVNKQAIKNIVRHYQDPKVGGVAGEKRIFAKEKSDATGAGEGIYWKYESKLKQWDSELHSVVGAAGELFSIRTDLYKPVPQDTIIEDFYMTLKIAQKGYTIKYEPDAYATEGQSASVAEEQKRKIRIAAGGLQAISRLTPLLNIFKYGILSFQYISHRVLRWTLAPLALPVIFILNVLIVLTNPSPLYSILLILQILFYLFGFLGYVFEKKEMKIKAFFVPYYFLMMNYSVYKGFLRIIRGKQKVTWERAERAF